MLYIFAKAAMWQITETEVILPLLAVVHFDAILGFQLILLTFSHAVLVPVKMTGAGRR